MSERGITVSYTWEQLGMKPPNWKYATFSELSKPVSNYSNETYQTNSSEKKQEYTPNLSGIINNGGY